MNRVGIMLIFGSTILIWYWLIYQILVRVNATGLMWFFYGLYVSATILAQVLIKLNEGD